MKPSRSVLIASSGVLGDQATDITVRAR